MNRHTRSAAALALVTAAGAVAAATPVGAQEEPLRYCTTEALTFAEIDAGVTNEITCYDDPEELPLGRMSTAAYVFDFYSGGGSSLQITEPCNGGVNFASGEWWNNRISSTDLYSCGTAKHWTGANGTGSNQTVTGGGYHNMNATLDNQTSSIQYAP